MDALIVRLTTVFIVLLILAMLLFAGYSWLEKEKRAFKRSIFIAVLVLAVLALQAFGFFPVYAQLIFLLFAVIYMLFLIIPFGNGELVFEKQASRVDERDIMFSRMELKAGTQKYNDYYSRHPDKKGLDDDFRKEPGLLSEKAAFYHPRFFGAAEAFFQAIQPLQSLVEGKIGQKSDTRNSFQLLEELKSRAKKLGALDVGFTRLQPQHLYTHIGRGAEYGEKVTLNHSHAIAFTVEMDHGAMRYNPKAPVIAESARQYFNAAKIATELARFLRDSGYEARAHIDANYRVICPLVARDAGLGELGRMGLLMTPRLGPRVRIGVVTTNLELPVKSIKPDTSMIHFCNICKKCAENCPSGSVSPEPMISGKKITQLKINHEACFNYWCRVGTDCGRCMAVCPYSHPDNRIHNLIRSLIRQNPANRRLFLALDHWFYGEKPPVISSEKE